MKKSLGHFFRKWYIIAAIVVLLIAGFYYLTHRSKAPSYETAVASVGTVTEKVSVTGKISPVDKADLAFEKSGVITAVNVVVGSSVKKGALIAKIDDAGDAAALASAQAKLDDLTRGLLPQEYAAEQTKVTSAQTTLSNAKQDALNSVRTAYIQAQSALVNYADTLFTNPQSANPVIAVHTDSSNIQNIIDNERVSISSVFTKWKADIDSLGQPAQAATLLGHATGYASTVKTYLGDLSVIVNNLSPGNSGLPQPAVDADLSTMNSALSAINQSVAALTAASSELNNASSAYDQANNNFNVALAGSSPQSIRAAAATVAGYQAELAKDSIKSPMDGLVTRVDPSVGEFVAAGSSAFSVESDGQYKIEAYVPEADIAKVSLNDTADVTLDAYGTDVHFAATVTAMDPAETILEDVPTYKVTLLFTQPDARIRSGMTANTDILTAEKDGVVAVPSRAIIDDNGAKTVRLLNADGVSFTIVPVTVGLKGSDGNTEVVSGLTAGEKVVTYVK